MYLELEQWLVCFDPNGGDGDEANAKYFMDIFKKDPQEKVEFIRLFSAMMKDSSCSSLEKFDRVVGLGPADDAEALAWLKHIYQVVTGEPWVGD